MSGIIRSVFNLLPADPVNRVKTLAVLTFAACVFALGFAYTAQYGFGLQPCILCLYQRWPYRIAAALSVLAFVFASGSRTVIPRALLAFCVIAFVIDAGIALFQVGVEQHWWQGTEKCTGANLEGLSPAELLEKIRTAPTVRCDEIQFEFLGLTMAAYNGLFALGLAGALALALGLKPTR